MGSSIHLSGAGWTEHAPPSDQKDRIFERFSQQKGQNFDTYGGTGIGLSISPKIVAAMGSTIEVNSTFGKGSRFLVSIPNVKNGAMETKALPCQAVMARERLYRDLLLKPLLKYLNLLNSPWAEQIYPISMPYTMIDKNSKK